MLAALAGGGVILQKEIRISRSFVKVMIYLKIYIVKIIGIKDCQNKLSLLD